MTQIKDVYGSVFESSTADLLARIVDSNGDLISGTDIVSIAYTIRERNACSMNGGKVVPGHEEISLVVSEVFKDGLQTDGAWTIDAIGYNFRHAIDTTANEAFLEAGNSYQVRYKLLLVGGGRLVFRYELKAI